MAKEVKKADNTNGNASKLDDLKAQLKEAALAELDKVREVDAAHDEKFANDLKRRDDLNAEIDALKNELQEVSARLNREYKPEKARLGPIMTQLGKDAGARGLGDI